MQGDGREPGLVAGLGRCPGEGNGNPLQYSYLTEEPGRLQSIGSHRVGHELSDLARTHINATL